MWIREGNLNKIRVALSVNGQEPAPDTAACRALVQLNEYQAAQVQHDALMEAKRFNPEDNQTINALRQQMRKNLKALQQELEMVAAQGGEHVVRLSAALGEVLLASEALDYRWTDRVRVKPKTGSLTID